MATSMSIEVDNPEDRSVWSSDIAPVVATVIQLKSVGYEYLEKGTLHGLPDAIRQNSCCCRTFWILTLSLALVTQLVHMTFLFDSAIQSATVTNIRYARVQELSLPFLTLCGHPGKFFDSDKLMVNNLSLSVALTFASMYGMFDPSVPTVSDKVDEALFHQALELDNRMFGGVKASNSRKLSLFLLKYTIDCENLFYGCQQGFAGAGKREKCCKSFRPVMTGRGLCYAFDHAGWNRSHVAGVFNGFSFYLNHSKLRFDDPVYSDSWKFGHLSDVSVSVSNGIEQSPLTNNYVAVGPGDDIQITTTTSLIKQLPKTSKCVDGATLDFYRDYTINNCVWERG